MKTIVCYGDSNTYGYNPENGFRYEYEERWTTILQKELKRFCDRDSGRIKRQNNKF